MLTRKEYQFDVFLHEIAQSLDISPDKYEEAMERYLSLKKHLEKGEYQEISQPSDIFIQGSFSLGTVIRPYTQGKDVDYDIDMVCRFEQNKNSTLPEKLKIVTGKEITSYARKNGMKNPEDKRRCWALEYSPDSNGIGFHIDILPCVYDKELSEIIFRKNPTLRQYADTTIAITNRDDDSKSPTYNWQSGNPRGYAKWFYDINLPSFIIFEKEQKRSIYENNKKTYASESVVRDELVRTPLQRAIQILKRHRDVHFSGHKWEKHKPISMIITTLAARLYEGNTNCLTTVYSTLNYLVQQLIAHASLLEPAQRLGENIAQMKLIQRLDNKWYIPNPVNPIENFADRWHEKDHICARVFFDWIRKLKQDFDTVSTYDEEAKIKEFLWLIFGKGSIERPIPIITLSKERPIVPIKPIKPWGF